MGYLYRAKMPCERHRGIPRPLTQCSPRHARAQRNQPLCPTKLLRLHPTAYREPHRPFYVFKAFKASQNFTDINACPTDYGNEKECGDGVARAIKDGLVKREELFIVSKLWNSFHDGDRVAPICKKQLADWSVFSQTSLAQHGIHVAARTGSAMGHL